MSDEAYYENRLKEEREKRDILNSVRIRQDARIAKLEEMSDCQFHELNKFRDRIAELEAENARLREAATAVIAERNYVRGDTALEFLIDKLESALLGGGE